MKTYMANSEKTERKWFVIDAAGKPVGKIAVAAADLLRGKNKPEFTPNADCGDFVIVVNAASAILTGKKAEQKVYRHHSGWVGGLKEVSYKTVMATKPEMVIEKAVKGMIPDTVIGRAAYLRLKVYAGAEHPHAAQKPELVK
jgi:large subunit ribosomal protein L13